MQDVLINFLLALTMVGFSVLISFHYLLPYSSMFSEHFNIQWKKENQVKKASHILQTRFELEFLQKCYLSTSQLCTQIVKLWFFKGFPQKNKSTTNCTLQ